jgi:hypothetical protein
MALTSRKKRPLDRTVPHRRDARLIIIAAEGRETEKQYFAQFRDTRVQVKVLPTGADNHSSPQHVIDRLKDFCNEYQIGDGDELWLMIDVDRWPPEALSQISAKAIQRGYQLAISNPCFEVWLLCHFQDPPADALACKTIESELRNALGGSYNKSRLLVSHYAGRLDAAMQRAQRLSGKANDRWPQAVGSHVYLTLQSIRKLAAP